MARRSAGFGSAQRWRRAERERHLVYHPLDLFNAGFQLSFGTVLALMLFTPKVLQWITRMKDADVMLARELSPPSSRIAAWWMSQEHALVRVLAAAGVAWFASFPLIAFHFEQLNPWAVAASTCPRVPGSSKSTSSPDAGRSKHGAADGGSDRSTGAATSTVTPSRSSPPTRRRLIRSYDSRSEPSREAGAVTLYVTSRL